jgi:tetratricopeptide (TPR) repeat protein/transcriptional regulator with XRE-family HTH domain
MAMRQSPPFGTLLRRYRVAAGLTQEALAARAGLSSRGISDLERGARRAPYRDTVTLLADALHLTAPERALFEHAAGRWRSPPVARSSESASDTWLTAVPKAPPLVGRASELALLAGHLAGKGPPFILLAGEPGIGKTRLLRETAARAREGGWTVLDGGCHQRGGQESFAPVLSALAQYLAHTTTTACARLRTDLQGSAWLVRLLPELSETGLVPVPEWTLPPDQERRLVFRAVGRYLANVAGPAGTLLVLDDLQWAGADALDLLVALLHPASEVPLRVVGAVRDTEIQRGGPLAGALADLARDGLARQLPLGPLAPHEAATLFERLFGDASDTSDALAERVVERTGGVPFFLVSCAQALRTGALEVGTAEAIPWDVAQTIRQRVAALPLAAQELLGIAAVIGRKAPRVLLLQVAAQVGWSRREVMAALEAACYARLLIEHGVGSYQFAHDLILEVVGADLSAARRTALHHDVAETLEQLPGAPPLEQLAYHYARTDDQPKALFYLEQAADQATARYAHAEAESRYRAVSDLARELGDRGRERAALEKLGTTLINVARYDEAIEVLEEAERLARATGDLEGRARAMAQLGYAHTRQGTASAGIARVQPYLELLAAAGLSTQGQAALHFTLATLFNNSSRYTEELAAAEQAVDLARSLSDDDLVAQAQMVRGMALMFLGRLDEALLTLEEAASGAETIGDLLTLSRAFMNMVGVHTRRGAFDHARACGERSREYVAQCGDPPLTALVYCNCGNTEYLAGEWDRARAFYQQAADTIREVRLSYAAPCPSLGLGQLCLAEGKGEEATRLLHVSIALSASSGILAMLRPAQATLAERDLLEGHPGTALERLTPLLDRRPDQEEAEVIPLLPLAAWAHLELSSEDVAAEVGAQSLKRALASGQRLVLPDALRVTALLALRQRRWHEAEVALEQALALARAMPYPYAEVKTLYVYGLLHMESGEPERAHERFREALVISAHLGERLYAAHIERALGRLG